MLPSEIELLHHILDECNYLLLEYNTNTYEDFLQNKRLSKAVCRSLEIIGEATKKINESVRLKYPQVEWKKMAGIRDIIIHNYFGVDYEIIWKTIEQKIPLLAEHVKNIIETEKL